MNWLVGVVIFNRREMVRKRGSNTRELSFGKDWVRYCFFFFENRLGIALVRHINQIKKFQWYIICGFDLHSWPINCEAASDSLCRQLGLFCFPITLSCPCSEFQQ